MKKIMAVAIIVLLTGPVFAQAGRVRITFYGFKCYRETWDDILGMDGRGDEVFFRFNISRVDQRGNAKQGTYERRTDVYGDRSGTFSNRIKAGTESATGGIRAGDMVNASYLLGEFDLDDGDIVTVIPTAWEQDPIADNSNAFSSTVMGAIGSVNQRIAPIMIGVHLLGGDLAGALFHGATLGMTASRPAGDQGELGRAGTRPIGMMKNGDFTPNLFSLNTPNLVKACNTNYGLGNGIVEVNYNEEALGNTRDHGNYSIFLKYEFVQKASPVVVPNGAPPPTPKNNAVPPPPTNTNTAPPPPAAANSNAAPAPANANASLALNRSYAQSPGITGRVLNAPVNHAITKTYTMPADWASSVWVGTRDGQSFALRFDPPTAWILKDVTHYTVEAGGVCKAADNVLTITYYLNNAQYTLTSNYYDAQTGQFSGVWQKAGDASQHGTWVVVRKK